MSKTLTAEKSYRTLSGLPLEASYGPEQARPRSLRPRLKACFPYTRGIHEIDVSRQTLDAMRQFAGLRDGRRDQRALSPLHLLAQGQSGLSVAFDLPTQMGFDSDHPTSIRRSGASAVLAISSLADMEALFADIPLGDVTVSMTINIARVHHLGHASGGRRAAGLSAWQKISGHSAERHPEGIHQR